MVLVKLGDICIFVFGDVCVRMYRSLSLSLPLYIYTYIYIYREIEREGERDSGREREREIKLIAPLMLFQRRVFAHRVLVINQSSLGW